MTAGYSGTPLPKKLGIKPDHRLALVDAPEDFGTTLGELPAAVEVRRSARGSADVLVYFTKSRAAFRKRLPALARSVYPDGSLWIAWPKRASKVPTDMTEDVVREVALPLGLVDNKVCAIDETWSGLRIVWRKENRGGSSAPI
jgi:hypothetical protein